MNQPLDVQYNIYNLCIKTTTFQMYAFHFRPIRWARRAFWCPILIIRLATIALSSSNCNPTSPWLWDMILVHLCVEFGTTSGIFSFIILIVVCLRWLVLAKDKSYTTISTLSSVRIDVVVRKTSYKGEKDQRRVNNHICECTRVVINTCK